MKDFTAWVAGKLKIEDPLVNMGLPGQYENPEYERQPLTVKQFRKLMKYLDTFERYPKQKARWDAYDRKIIYWTAVSTGYREAEMMKLRKWNFYLSDRPPVISLKQRDSKTKVKGEVPIARDLALALKKYIAGLDANDKVLPFPETSGSIVDMLRKDLEGAGIPWKLPSGEVIDFHTFRSTFITWALDVYGLTPKRVMILARLKSIAVLQNYSRNLRIEDFGWLDKGPRLVQPNPKKKAG
jgi:integrase